MAVIASTISYIFSLMTTIFVLFTISVFTTFTSDQNSSMAINAWKPTPNVTGDQDNVFGNEHFVDFLTTVCWNILLVVVFVLQHSGMASDWWKRNITVFRFFGMERTVYVIATCASLLMIANNWHEIDIAPLWYIDTSERFYMWLFFLILHLLCWFLILSATLLLDVSELIGFKELHYYCSGIRYKQFTDKSREMGSFLRHMRHPGATCMLVIFWIHPLMTWQRFIYSLMLTTYILFGFSVTEADHVYTKSVWYHRTSYVTYERYSH